MIQWPLKTKLYVSSEPFFQLMSKGNHVHCILTPCFIQVYFEPDNNSLLSGMATVNLESLMVTAYNMKLKETPFYHSHLIHSPSMPVNPYTADLETVDRIKYGSGYGGSGYWWQLDILVHISGLHTHDDLMVSQHFFLLELEISGSIFKGMEGKILSIYHNIDWCCDIHKTWSLSEINCIHWLHKVTFCHRWRWLSDDLVTAVRFSLICGSII